MTGLFAGSSARVTRRLWRLRETRRRGSPVLCDLLEQPAVSGPPWCVACNRSPSIAARALCARHVAEPPRQPVSAPRSLKDPSQAASCCGSNMAAGSLLLIRWRGICIA
jgi:hypothetical protein